MNTLILAIVLIFPQTVQELEQKANKAINEAEIKYLGETPSPKPVEECPCDGKGYVVHGDGHRTLCPGTSEGPCKYRPDGQINTKSMTVELNGATYKLVPLNAETPNKPKVRNAEIEICGATWCEPCQKLKRDAGFLKYVENLKKVGWKVKFLELDTLGQKIEMPKIPYARVYNKGKKHLVPVYGDDNTFYFNDELRDILNKQR